MSSRKHVARTVLILVALLAALLTPVYMAANADATVATIPTGRDCLRPPTPESPTVSVPSWIDPGPENAPDGDAFDPNSGTTLYDKYGYAGYMAHIFDPGCLDGTRVYDFMNDQANTYMQSSLAWTAISVRLTRTVMGGTFGSIWDPMQKEAARITGNGLFIPLLGVGIAVTGLYVMAQAKRGDVAEQSKSVMGAVMILVVGAAVVAFPVTVGAKVDEGMTAAFSAANQLLTTNGGEQPRDAADMVASNMVSSVAYNTWAAETFGQNGPAAEKYGPELFKSGVFSRAEQREIDADPSKAGRMIDGKKDAYKDTARKVQEEFPQAYEALAGNDTKSRAGHALVGGLSTAAALFFLCYCLVRTMWAMVVTRVGIGLAPMISVFTQVPSFQHIALEALTWVAEAVGKAILFGFVFAVFLAGGIGGIMDPSSEMHPAMKAFALIMMTVAMMALFKRLGVSKKWRRPATPRERHAREQAPQAAAPGAQGVPHRGPVDVGQVRVSSMAGDVAKQAAARRVIRAATVRSVAAAPLTGGTSLAAGAVAATGATIGARAVNATGATIGARAVAVPVARATVTSVGKGAAHGLSKGTARAVGSGSSVQARAITSAPHRAAAKTASIGNVPASQQVIRGELAGRRIYRAQSGVQSVSTAPKPGAQVHRLATAHATPVKTTQGVNLYRATPKGPTK